ncbi:MAG TPA: hypothetical protein VM571_03920 [Noviherbaspirillum sp.]|jgi:hypothetical protein|nr:hypothetical protein [Noviherbaspirillum sp.]
MKLLLSLLLAATALSVHAKEDPAHLKAVIEQHKAIAAAHEAAAQCLASGKDEELCHTDLLKACKGIAIGKLCGMKHKH